MGDLKAKPKKINPEVAQGDAFMKEGDYSSAAKAYENAALVMRGKSFERSEACMKASEAYAKLGNYRHAGWLVRDVGGYDEINAIRTFPGEAAFIKSGKGDRLDYWKHIRKFYVKAAELYQKAENFHWAAVNYHEAAEISKHTLKEPKIARQYYENHKWLEFRQKEKDNAEIKYAEENRKKKQPVK